LIGLSVARYPTGRKSAAKEPVGKRPSSWHLGRPDPTPIAVVRR
jgi:hypothetical protein